MLVRKLYKDPSEFATLKELLPARFRRSSYTPIREEVDDDASESDAFLKPNNRQSGRRDIIRPGSPSSSIDLDDDHPMMVSQAWTINQSNLAPLTLVETFKLSFEFCFIWFAANYFVAACLEYTTVASGTILTSTSSIWTLLIGTLWGVEIFTVKKLLGVLASLAGIMLISSVDFSGSNNENRGTFPHKSLKEVAVGDSMAFLSAILYGLYAVVMKKRMGNEARINMPMFFGMVGLLNLFIMWPGFLILHYTGIETFELPPSRRILTIILVRFMPLLSQSYADKTKVNSSSSLVSDFCWAYAMLLTSPLVVTVGLSMTIPLSLIGQMLIHGQYSGGLYWIGATVVLCSFIFINREEAKDEEAAELAASLVLHDANTPV
jgi:solute carrier family 35 protein F5